MASHIGDRRHSTSHVSSARDEDVVVREFRRKRASDERDHRKSRAPIREEVQKVYVYRHVDSSRKRKEEPREHYLRRSSDTVARHKYEQDARRSDDAQLKRRESKRRHSSHKERDERPQTHVRRRSGSSQHGHRTVPRSPSVRERPTPSASHPPLQRSRTSVHRSGPIPQVARSTSPSDIIPSQPTPFRRKPDRPSSLIGSIFSSHKPPKPTLRPLPKPPPPEKLVECLTCLSDVPVSRSAKLACQHHMCNSCLRRIFTLSITDPQHMPPKCCTTDHIPLKHVEKLFDLKFKKTWNRKYQEYTTQNRIYCPARGCGEWIKPANIHVDTSGGIDGGRKYGKCTRCRTKVCCTCNGRWHAGQECPKDEATARFAEIAKQEGWQRCYNCSATVELKEGCNHMTCRCTAEFCMICGLKWKTCDCPWFNYEAVENDRLNHMQIPQPVPVPVQPQPQPPPPARPANPALGYQEEMERRRQQERADEALARRLQAMGLNEIPEPPPPPRQAVNVHAYLVHPAPHLAPEFIRRAQDVLSAAQYPAQANRAANDLLNNMRRPIPPAQIPVARAPPADAPPMLRQHSAASRAFNNHAATRPSERVVPRRAVNDYESERLRHRPAGMSMEEPRHSLLAGLTSGTAEGRVDTWRRHVEV